MVLRRDRELVHITFHNGPGQLYIRLSIGRGASPRNAWAQGGTGETLDEGCERCRLVCYRFHVPALLPASCLGWGATLVNAAMYLGVTLIHRIARMYLLSRGLARFILRFC